MPRAKTTRTIHRLESEEIEKRRQHVTMLDAFGYRPQEIVNAILADPDAAALLSGQAAPNQTVKDDLEVIRKQQQSDLALGIGGVAFARFVSDKRALLRRAIIASETERSAAARMVALKIASDAQDAIARAQGVPLDRPINVDVRAMLVGMGVDASLIGQMFLGGGNGTAQGLLTGKVDALTFATDPYYCGLSTIPERFPMQEIVLRDFMSPTSNRRTLVLVCGMRSGKGVVASVVAWYAAYELLSLDDPQAYFGLTPNQEIQIITLATNQQQAKNNLFKHIKDRLATGGGWFANLRDRVSETGLELRLPQNIVIRCGHSKATGLVGATSYVVILDELSKFKDTEGRDNADDVYDQMNATTATFKDAGRVLCLGSPEWVGDKGMRLLGEALEIDPEGRPIHPTMMGLQLATWEANLNLSQDYLWEAFNGAANPTAFWRDFGARPPEAQEAYYPDPERWDRQADPDRHHPYDEAGRLSEDFRPCCDSRRFVHVDLGLSRDACGVAMAHKPVPGCPYFQAKDEPNPKARKIVLDVAMQIAPPREREAKAEISFERVRQLIYDWEERGFKIKGGQVSYDGWQSIDSQQMLKRKGFRTAEFSLDRDLDGHDTLQELINTNELSFYPHPILIREAKALSLMRGKKVDHPKNGSKDVVDAVAGACYFALKRGGRIAFVG